MARYWDKQNSSRPILTTTSTANAFKAAAETYQIRVITSAAGNLQLADSSSTTTVLFVPISANVAGEYFTISPGQWVTPCAGMSVTEMS